ncbi:MAG: bifunctional diaminohydroxyphosphoribosylaminopyrimidine deaminase/5-amino-6-(5-phosphoribosylamino)uracil reductase RibD [Firmicutes bacterium]|nr:bifunctional diaminohydroxyphosphoribosylaminopyrimidine deaminase/5-amino-6-(5-phosphoribosylamino)uracil reductase RibD [Bacillota bacterium]
MTKNTTENDEKFMRYALALAKKGMGRTNPNPMVGSVIVKDGKIISEGFHAKYGEFHAERNAILACKEDMTGATIYVTLEPCCHHGKTPPCTDIITESGIKKVVVGCVDTNPKVGGKGIKILRDNGIEVITGVLEEECRKLNEVFFHFIETKMPFVVMKYAMTADGKICTHTGSSKWITSEKARQHVHYTRNRLASVMVGIGTVEKDDPMLNCRIENGRDPVRIICDSKLSISEYSNIISTSDRIRTIIAANNSIDENKADILRKKGAEVICAGDGKGRVDLYLLMKKLGEMNIDSILLEGGATLNNSALKCGIVNRINVYIAPKIFGGGGKSPFEGTGVNTADAAYRLELINTEHIGEDILLDYKVR